MNDHHRRQTRTRRRPHNRWRTRNGRLPPPRQPRIPRAVLSSLLPTLLRAPLPPSPTKVPRSTREQRSPCFSSPRDPRILLPPPLLPLLRRYRHRHRHRRSRRFGSATTGHRARFHCEAPSGWPVMTRRKRRVCVHESKEQGVEPCFFLPVFAFH